MTPPTPPPIVPADSTRLLLRQLVQIGLRVEAKIDAVLRRLKDPSAAINPMSYTGQADPLSNMPIVYYSVQLDDGTSVTFREDGNRPPGAL